MKPLIFSAFALAATPGLASSPEAWDEFRAEVDAACTALAQAEAGPDVIPVIDVNPFGSASYGAALVTMPLGDIGSDVMICIFDKSTKTAELTAPFSPQRSR